MNGEVKARPSDPGFQLSDEVTNYVPAGTPVVSAREPEVATARTERFTYGTPEYIDAMAVHEAVRTNAEQGLRDQLAINENLREDTRRQTVIAETVRSIRSQRPLVEEDLAAIQEMRNAPLYQPSIVFEQKLADRVIADTRMEEADKRLASVLKEKITHHHALRSVVEDFTDRYRKQGVVSTALDILPMFVPFYSQYRKSNLLGKEASNSWLQGANIEQQHDYLQTLPAAEARDRFEKALKELEGKNPTLANEYAQQMLGLTTADVTIDNIFTGIDALSLTPIGLVAKGVRAAASPVQAGKALGATASAAVTSAGPVLLNSAKNIYRAATQFSVPRARTIYAASGQTPKAALDGVRDLLEVTAANGTGASIRGFSELRGMADTLFDPEAIFRDAANAGYSPEATRRMAEAAYQDSANLLQSMVDNLNVTRLAPGTPEYDIMMSKLYDHTRLQYGFTDSQVLWVMPRNSADNALGNVHYIEIGVGTQQGLPYPSLNNLKSAMKIRGVGEYTPEEVSPGQWIAKLTKTANEGDRDVREALKTTLANSPDKAPEEGVGAILGRIRSRDEVLPPSIVEEIKNATYGGQRLNNLAQAQLESAYAPLRKDQRKDLEYFRQYQRDWIHPSKGTVGVYSHTAGEFASDFYNLMGRLPSEAEQVAYFTYNRIEQAQYTALNLNLYRSKASLGFERWKFRTKGVKDDLPADIEGRLVDSRVLSAAQEDASVLHVRPDGTREFIRLRYDSKKKTAMFEDINLNGYKVVQLSDEGMERYMERYPGLPKEFTPRFIVAKDTETRPLSLYQLPRHDGGHRVYKYENYVAQPKVRSGVSDNGQKWMDYYDDLNLFNVQTPKQAKEIADAMEQARLGFLDGLSDAQLGEILARATPITGAEFRDLINRNVIDRFTPISWRKKGGTAMDNSTLKADREREGFAFTDTRKNAMNPFGDSVNMRFAQERDLPMRTIDRVGDHANPVFKFRDAPVLDPNTMLARSNAQVFGGRYLDDLKFKTAAKFVAQYQDILEGDAYMMQQYPIRALYEAKFKTGSDPRRVASAKNYQLSAKQFFNVPGWEAAKTEFVKDIALNFAFGKNVLGYSMGDIVEWAFERDPLKALRKFALVKNMGFWNPKQWFMQAQGVANIIAIEGHARGMKAMAGANFLRPLTLTNREEIAKVLADHASKFGWDKEHFREMYTALQRTGFAQVGNEYDYLGETVGNTLNRNLASRAIDSSLMFFKMGERVNRLTAWAAAYDAWRTANPLKKLGDAEIKSILNRADLLSMNMSRGSDAAWQHGWLKTPTQFWSYQARILDLMWGQRLTAKEKARMLLVQSTLYGVPLGVLGTTTGLVWQPHKAFREGAVTAPLQKDRPEQWSVVEKAFMDGLPQAMVNFVTGEDPAIASTFGPNGLSFVRDVLAESDSNPVWKMFTGATGTTLSDLWSRTSRLGAVVGQTMREDGGNMNIQAGDFVDALSWISTLKGAARAYAIMSTGQYLSKDKGSVIVDDLGGTSALFAGLLGTLPQSVEDHYSRVEWKKGEQEAQRQASSIVKEAYRKAYEIGISEEDRLRHFKRAFTYGRAANMTTDQMWRAHQDVLKSLGTSAAEQLENTLQNLNSERQQLYYKEIFGVKN